MTSLGTIYVIKCLAFVKQCTNKTGLGIGRTLRWILFSGKSISNIFKNNLTFNFIFLIAVSNFVF